MKKEGWIPGLRVKNAHPGMTERSRANKKAGQETGLF
jgi:hypothetical protein